MRRSEPNGQRDVSAGGVTPAQQTGWNAPGRLRPAWEAPLLDVAGAGFGSTAITPLSVSPSLASFYYL